MTKRHRTPRSDSRPASLPPLYATNDAQALYGNGALSQWATAEEDVFSPYSDVWGPSPYEKDLTRQKLKMAHPDWAEMSEEDKQAAVDDQSGAMGWASTRISRHYGDQTEVKAPTDEEKHAELDLSDDKGRLAALSRMRQNSDPMSLEGQMRCGASSLVGGAVYGGGKAGVGKLLSSIEAERKAKGLPPLDAESMKGIRSKLDDPDAKLTMDDLDVVTSATYDHFKAKGGGIKSKDLQGFIDRNKDMKDMFDAREMGLDSIDTSGSGKGNHLVLGIGRRGRSGVREMVYDPQARQDKENWGDYMDSEQANDIRREERAKKRAEYMEIFDNDKLDPAIADQELRKLDAEVAAAAKSRQYEYKHDSQLVTDPKELEDYHTATDTRVTADGFEDLDQQTSWQP